MRTSTIPPAATVPVALPTTEVDDQELAVRFARGDEAALVEIIERYQPRVAGLACRLLGWRGDADDVVQDVFLAALESRGRFRGESNLWTWLATITVHRCRSRQRRAWLRDKLAAVLPLKRFDRSPPPAPDAPAIAAETASRVRAAIAELPQSLREAIVLRYLEELSIAQVAQALNLNRNAVEVRLTRARKLLEARLADMIEA